MTPIWKKIGAGALVVSIASAGFVVTTAPAAADGGSSYHRNHHRGHWRHDSGKEPVYYDGRREPGAIEWSAAEADVYPIYAGGPVNYSGCRKQYAPARDNWNNFLGYQLVWICN